MRKSVRDCEASFLPNHYRYMAALALYSKCLTVAEAIIVLLEAGFSDEAFGMTRTLVDVFITLHYICNKDTEARAKLYCQFTAKDSEVWSKIAPDYWPHLAMPMDAETKKVAARYPHPHQWSGKTVKDMALEPDTIETDPSTGNAVVHDFAYRVIFRWTSHYVHPTIVSLDNHLVQAGHDNFIVHGRHRKNMGFLTVFNLASFVVNTMICFHRCMGELTACTSSELGDRIDRPLGQTPQSKAINALSPQFSTQSGTRYFANIPETAQSFRSWPS